MLHRVSWAFGVIDPWHPRDVFTNRTSRGDCDGKVFYAILKTAYSNTRATTATRKKTFCRRAITAPVVIRACEVCHNYVITLSYNNMTPHTRTHTHVYAVGGDIAICHLSLNSPPLAHPHLMGSSRAIYLSRRVSRAHTEAVRVGDDVSERTRVTRA